MLARSFRCGGDWYRAGGTSRSKICGSQHSTRGPSQLRKKQCSAILFKMRRCLMPASGYYEWLDTPEGKQPYFFSRKDGEPLTFAAIQDAWDDPESGERIRSCAMVITEANKFVGEIHDRMPVILEPKDFDQWERGDVKDAAALMEPAADDLLRKWTVSKRVNSSKADDEDATLIEPVAVETSPVNATPRKRSADSDSKQGSLF